MPTAEEMDPLILAKNVLVCKVTVTLRNLIQLLCKAYTSSHLIQVKPINQIFEKYPILWWSTKSKHALYLRGYRKTNHLKLKWHWRIKKKNVWLKKQERNEEGNVEKQSQKKKENEGNSEGDYQWNKKKWGQFMDKRGKTKNNKTNN